MAARHGGRKAPRRATGALIRLLKDSGQLDSGPKPKRPRGPLIGIELRRDLTTRLRIGDLSHKPLNICFAIKLYKLLASRLLIAAKGIERTGGHRSERHPKGILGLILQNSDELDGLFGRARDQKPSCCITITVVVGEILFERDRLLGLCRGGPPVGRWCFKSFLYCRVTRSDQPRVEWRIAFSKACHPATTQTSRTKTDRTAFMLGNLLKSTDRTISREPRPGRR